MTNYKITITSDIICPWCYIGHTRLSRAISNHKTKYPNDTFVLEYKPFYLNPSPPSSLSSASTSIGPNMTDQEKKKKLLFPGDSKPRLEMYTSKFGAARATQIFGMLDKVARSEGLEFKFGGKTGHSRNGHRLVWFAQRGDRGNNGAIGAGAGVGEVGEEGTKQNQTMLALWRRYFSQEVDITTLETLVDVGVECGLGTSEEIERFLVSGEGADEVDRVAEAERIEGGISGVPFYDVQGRWGVEGAQEPKAFEVLFEKWKVMEDVSAKVSGGDTATNAAVGENDEVGGGKLC